MRVHLERIEDQPFSWVEPREIAASELAAHGLDGGDLLEVKEIDWRGEIRRTSPGYLLKASVRYQQKVACTRCLESKIEAIESEIELVLVVEESEEPVEFEKELGEDDLGVLTLHEPFYETDALLEEQILLNLPMRVLCQDGCAGLCDACGHNLNRGPCDCSTDTVDPRWEALKDVKDRLS